jgi:hypothetical protein
MRIKRDYFQLLASLLLLVVVILTFMLFSPMRFENATQAHLARDAARLALLHELDNNGCINVIERDEMWNLEREIIIRKHMNEGK